MKNLIEALTIFSKYSNAKRPTSCDHDTLYVNIDPKGINSEDITKLENLGFLADFNNRYFYSFVFGSC